MSTSLGSASAPRVIVALDFASSDQAIKFSHLLNPGLCKLKIGFELFLSAGPSFISRLIEGGFDVFLDLKFHDIPNTVAAACRAASRLGVWMINVHASGGRAMLQAARDAVSSENPATKLIAVTVLTSLDDADIAEIGIDRSAAEQALHLAGLANECGLDGVVCSARDAAPMRRRYGEHFLLITPGIRPRAGQTADQKRVMTAMEAINAGADYLVVGRPITRAANPAAVLAAVNAEIGVLT